MPAPCLLLFFPAEKALTGMINGIGRSRITIQARIYNNIIIFVLIGVSLCRGDQGDELYKKYLATIMTGYHPEQNDLSWVTPDIKQVVIQKAQTAYSSADPTTHSNALEALIILGDQPIIRAYIADCHQGKTGVMPSIQVLPYLIDDLYNGDSVRKSNFHASIMDQSKDTIYQILRSYPDFPLDTRKWADSEMGSLGGEGPNSSSVQLLRYWWEHNKVAVLAHKYADANWLPTKNQIVPSSPISSRTPALFATNSSLQFPLPSQSLAQLQPVSETGIPCWIYGPIAFSIATIIGAGYYLSKRRSNGP